PTDDGVFRIVECPRVGAFSCLTPSPKTRMQALGVGRIEELDQARQPPRLWGEGQGSAQSLVQVPLLTDVERACTRGARQQLQPAPEELQMARARRQLQRIEAGSTPVSQRQIFATELAHQPLESTIFVEHDLRCPMAREQGNEESNQ